MRTHLSYGNKKDGLEMRGTISRIVNDFCHIFRGLILNGKRWNFCH